MDIPQKVAGDRLSAAEVNRLRDVTLVDDQPAGPGYSDRRAQVANAPNRGKPRLLRVRNVGDATLAPWSLCGPSAHSDADSPTATPTLAVAGLGRGAGTGTPLLLLATDSQPIAAGKLGWARPLGQYDLVRCRVAQGATLAAGAVCGPTVAPTTSDDYGAVSDDRTGFLVLGQAPALADDTPTVWLMRHHDGASYLARITEQVSSAQTLAYVEDGEAPVFGRGKAKLVGRGPEAVDEFEVPIGEWPLVDLPPTQHDAPDDSLEVVVHNVEPYPLVVGSLVRISAVAGVGWLATGLRHQVWWAILADDLTPTAKLANAQLYYEDADHQMVATGEFVEVSFPWLASNRMYEAGTMMQVATDSASGFWQPRAIIACTTVVPTPPPEIAANPGDGDDLNLLINEAW